MRFDFAGTINLPVMGSGLLGSPSAEERDPSCHPRPDPPGAGASGACGLQHSLQGVPTELESQIVLASDPMINERNGVWFPPGTREIAKGLT